MITETKNELALDKIGSALVKAIAEIPTIPKNAQAYGYKYATLDDILTIVKPILSKHGLAILQPLDGDKLVTILLHESGQHISEAVTLPLMDENKKMNAAQAVGATITYMRRYAMSSMLCISTDEDTDGAVKTKAKTTQGYNPKQGKETEGSFSSFKPAAEVKTEQRKPQVPEVEAEIEDIKNLMADEGAEEIARIREEVVLNFDKKEKPSPVIDWDEKVRVNTDLCSKKQASYIYSLAQRAFGQDFEMEDMTGFTETEGVSADEFVDLDAKSFCGRLTKRNATKVITVLKELAGIESKN